MIVKLETPAFELRPPSTICTCFCWLSPSELAVGFANGFVGVWSLSLSDAKATELCPGLSMYFPVHDTYVLNVVSAYPTYPFIIATTGMDGQTRLLSLLDPRADMVETARSRGGTPQLSYSPFVKSFVSVDEADLIRALPVRRFFSTLTVMKSNNGVSAITPSNLCHPSILLGNVGGEVVGSNPIRRVLDTKEKHLQQVWFHHEWIPYQNPHGLEDNVEILGASRFFDGFRAENLNLARNLVGDDRIVNGVLSTTIFEEGTAITVLAWNPNESFAGWACAGMGCGLLRIEDLSI